MAKLKILISVRNVELCHDVSLARDELGSKNLKKLILRRLTSFRFY